MSDTLNRCKRCGREKGVHIVKKGKFSGRKIKTCFVCRKINDRRYREKNRTSVRDSQRAYYHKNIDRVRKINYKRHLKNKYGITEQELIDLMEKSNYGCFICGKKHDDKQKLNIDHCHKTGKIRGLLCWDCNIGISKFKDNSTLMERAASYVRAN